MGVALSTRPQFFNHVYLCYNDSGAGDTASALAQRLLREDLFGRGIDLPTIARTNNETIRKRREDVLPFIEASLNVVLILTREVFQNPWVQVELYTAVEAGGNITVLGVREASFSVQDTFKYLKGMDENTIPPSHFEVLKSQGVPVRRLQRLLLNIFETKVMRPPEIPTISVSPQAELDPALKILNLSNINELVSNFFVLPEEEEAAGNFSSTQAGVKKDSLAGPHQLLESKEEGKKQPIAIMPTH